MAKDRAGRSVSFSLLHEPYHGLHHLHVGLPHAELPRLADELLPAEPEDVHPYPSYGHAFLDLLRNLANPRVGSQWRTGQGGSPHLKDS